MKSFFMKLASVLLCLSLMVPLVTVPASAVTVEAITAVLSLIASAGNAVESLANATSSTTQMVQDIKDFLGTSGSGDGCDWIASSYYIGAPLNRTETTKDVLCYIAQDWNRNYASKAGFSVEVVSVSLEDGIVYSAILCLFSQGIGRGDLPDVKYFLCDGSGRILCSNDTSDMDGHWEPFYNSSALYSLRSYEALYNKAQEIGGYLVRYKNYWVISSNDGERGWYDPSGLRLAAVYDENSWAINQDRNDTTVKDESGVVVDIGIEDNSTSIDLSGMTITLPDGSINLIDQLIYDESTKSYHIDSHDTYNTTTNYYYEWNYYINYTSITYIGQTEEYNKYYEVYYELPDGRDSADLTAEELEQLNVSMDVIPYGRSADDTSLRCLYHFDGDTKDSSYWNYCTDFTWNKGASVTYMDAGVFDGALYLDETEHDFTITLPSNIGGNDFTLQFRYYQSFTAAPQTDSYLSIGGNQYLKFNGSSFLNGSGTALASTPIGSWNEIALIRSGNRLYYYLNGVSIGSISLSGSLGDKLTFHFGSSQQTYKYLDELRFVYQPMATGGSNYMPTSVPFDTNLSLVLPDSSIPLADEYWKIESSGTNILSSSGMDDWLCVDPGSITGLTSSAPDFSYSESGGYWTGDVSYTSVSCKYPNWYYYSNITDVGSFSDGTYLSTSPYVDDGTWKQYQNDFGTSSYVRRFPTDGLFSRVGYYSSTSASSYTGYLPDGTYTLSILWCSRLW